MLLTNNPSLKGKLEEIEAPHPAPRSTPSYTAKVSGGLRTSTSTSIRTRPSSKGQKVQPNLFTKASLWDNIEVYDESLSESSLFRKLSWREKLHRMFLHVQFNLETAVMCAQQYPSILIIPLIVFAIIVALGIFGVISAANTDVSNQKGIAASIAVDTVAGFELQLEQAYTPAVTLATLIRQQPNFTAFNQSFADVGQELLAQTSNLLPDAIQELQVSPFGVLLAVIGTDVSLPVPYIDLFAQASLRAGALATVASGNLTLSGPLPLVVGGTQAVIIRLPVYIANSSVDETWGTLWYDNRTGATDCNICYNATTRTKFWGFTTAIVYLDSLTNRSSARLGKLSDHGYYYRITNAKASDSIVFSSNPPPGKDPVQVPISVPGGLWTLSVTDQDGWQPSWRNPLIATVVIVAAIVSFLLFGMMFSRRQHLQLLQTMLPQKVIDKLKTGQAYFESYKSVTVLFADIVSYTTLAADMPVGKVVQLLNEVYTQWDYIAERHSVYKMKHIGDAYMCLGGCPDVLDPVEAAARVARVALEMMDHVSKYRSREGQGIRIRIGIHSGPVVASVIGLSTPQYSVFGDAVNVASRMESHGTPMRIHISSQTYELLRQAPDHFELRPRGEIQVKGKGVMFTYWVVTDCETQDSTDGASIDGMHLGGRESYMGNNMAHGHGLQNSSDGGGGVYIQPSFASGIEMAPMSMSGTEGNGVMSLRSSPSGLALRHPSRIQQLQQAFGFGSPQSSQSMDPNVDDNGLHHFGEAPSPRPHGNPSLTLIMDAAVLDEAGAAVHATARYPSLSKPVRVASTSAAGPVSSGLISGPTVVSTSSVSSSEPVRVDSQVSRIDIISPVQSPARLYQSP